MKALHDLKDKLYMELDELVRKGDIGAGDLELAHKLTDTIKNIDKICALEKDDGYSNTGVWDGSYNYGNSYRGRSRDSMGRYSRDGRMMGGRMYSRSDAKDHMMMEMEEAMNAAASEHDREIIRRAMSQLEKE